MGELATTGPGNPIGDGRDTATMAQALADGRNLIVAGRLGSGKSYILRDVVQRLRDAEHDPLVLHSSGRLVAQQFTALELCADPRSTALHGGHEHSGRKLIVVIDDMHTLDASSAGTIVRAVYAGQATVLASIAVDQDGVETDAARLAVDLWLGGLADRTDLEELQAEDAERLLEAFTQGAVDSVTRAVIIAHANRSRLLLREFAADAITAIRNSRDPVDAFVECPRHSRLGEALAAHARQLGEDERVALAVLGRTTGIHYADATRFISPPLIDSLIGRGLVYDDDTSHRRMTANAPLARIVEQEIGAARIDAVLAPIAARMLTARDAWWSSPLAVLIAAAWHGGTSPFPSWDDADDDTRVRVCLDAALHANEIGDLGLAAAYAHLGLSVIDSAALRMELAFAQIAGDEDADPTPFLERFDVQQLDPGSLVRCSDLCVLLGSAGDAAEVGRVMSRAEREGFELSAETITFRLARAQLAGLDMRWQEAFDHAEWVFRHTGATPGFRLVAASVAGLCATHLGSWTDAERWFARAARLTDERATGRATSQMNLTAVFIELLARAQSGAESGGLSERIASQRIAAAREGDMSMLALAGIVTSIASALGSDPAAAMREIAASGQRLRHEGLAVWMGLAELTVTRALALLGEHRRARTILDGIDPAQIPDTALMQHERWTTVSAVLLAEGHRDGAAMACRLALEHASHGQNPGLLVRDYYLLATQSADDRGLLAKVLSVAETIDLPATRVIALRTVDLIQSSTTANDTPIEHARAASVWCTSASVSPVRREHFSVPASAATNGIDKARSRRLTRREREIALLVHEGLTNREIADHLYLSVRTVESHVYQARGKLKAPSRGELGRIVAALVRSKSGAVRA